MLSLITYGIRWVLDNLELLFVGTPWIVVASFIVLLTALSAGRRAAVFAAAFLSYMGILGFWEKAMTTLALLGTAAMLSIIIGIPLGMFCARRPKVYSFIRPIMDFMQTMPAFVFMIPVIAFFGTGKPAAVVTTMIFGGTPVVRLTVLGLRGVPDSIREAAISYGASKWYLLRKVDLPLAAPSILAGVNQTIMLSLAMVVVASLIGAKGLGEDVLEALQYASVGQGILAMTDTENARKDNLPHYKKPFALPPSWYYDNAVYRAEAVAIYNNSWLCAGHKAELKDPGDFVRLDFCEESVLVVRGADSVVRAFFNVCQHRGHILVDERRGKFDSNIVCPYHAWGYSTDGNLKYAPNLKNVTSFPIHEIKLPQVQVAEYGSFVWVNVNPNAKPISEEMPGLDAAIVKHIPDVDDAVFFEGNSTTLPINWKTQVDNAIDTYHFKYSGPAHRQLSNSMQFDGFQRTTHGKWLVEWGLPAPDGKGVAYEFSPNAARGEVDGFSIIWVYPDLQIVGMPGSRTFMTYRTTPFGAEKTVLDYAYSGAEAAKGSTTARAAIDWMNGPLSDEDNAYTLAVHQGHKSQGFTGSHFIIDTELSRYSEHPGEAFHKMVFEQVNPFLKSP